MMAILEMKQKIKNLYGDYEAYILPVLKLGLALLYFLWINMNMGYMPQLDNIFVVLVLSLICCILPSSVTVFCGVVLMLGHCYAVGLETAGFLLGLLLIMLIFLLRFSKGKNIVLAYTPLSFGLSVPVLLPIGCGLLSNVLSALPAGCGVILYYFVRLVRNQFQFLSSTEVQSVDKLRLLVDTMVTDWAMWVTLVAYVAVILVVYVIRTRAFDYAWKFAIVAGGVVYVLVLLTGGFFLEVRIEMVPLVVYAVSAVVVGLLLEFLVFGGDYSRTERVQYEDDEYYYYVKAVPKSYVSTYERSIKKINAESAAEDEEEEFRPAGRSARSEKRAKPDRSELSEIDFERKLEESLKDL